MPIRAENESNASKASLETVAESDVMIWNAVAVDRDRIFVAGPRWAGANAPALAQVNEKGSLDPYPDAFWNSWQPGADASAAFVNVNAIRHDEHGNLWVIDTGSPTFGGDPVPNGAKVVEVDVRTNRISRIYTLGPKLALPGSYVDDIRFYGGHAYLTDAGRPGLIVLDLTTGAGGRVLGNRPSVTAPPNRPIVVDEEIVRAPDGLPLKVNSDPMEVSRDGKYLYYGTLHGPWSRIETRLLDDPAVPPVELASHVESWADLLPVGGTVMAVDGSLFFSDLVDAPTLSGGYIWLPAAQLDRSAPFHKGVSKIQWPVRLYRYPINLQMQ